MSALVITGAGTNIGKTYVTCRLIEALRAREARVTAFKPVLSGFDERAAGESDAGLLLRALGRTVTAEAIAEISPWRFRAPLGANMAARLEGRSVDYAAILEACRNRSGAPALIEGAGGVMAPLDDAHTVLDLIVALEAPTLLVVGAYLGAISHALTAIAALAQRGRAPLAVIVNEGGDDGVDLGDTLETLQGLAPGVRFVALARGRVLPPAIADLALAR